MLKELGDEVMLKERYVVYVTTNNGEPYESSKRFSNLIEARYYYNEKVKQYGGEDILVELSEIVHEIDEYTKEHIDLYLIACVKNTKIVL